MSGLEEYQAVPLLTFDKLTLEIFISILLRLLFPFELDTIWSSKLKDSDKEEEVLDPQKSSALLMSQDKEMAKLSRKPGVYHFNLFIYIVDKTPTDLSE